MIYKLIKVQIDGLSHYIFYNKISVMYTNIHALLLATIHTQNKLPNPSHLRLYGLKESFHVFFKNAMLVFIGRGNFSELF